MVNYPPKIEQLTPAGSYLPSGNDIPWHNTLRVKIFALTFVAITVIGLGYTFSQSPVYRSQATLLTSTRTAVDSRSPEADAQHVAIQRQILRGDELIAVVQARLTNEGYENLDTAEIKRYLGIEAVPDTNLLAMVAVGDDAELLPHIINTSIDVYFEARAADIAENTRHTVRLIEDELGQLALKLEQARAGLAAFRDSHEIISEERSENDVLARLSGLQRSLNSALEEEVKARSRLEAMQEAIARGDTVIPRSALGSLLKQEAELERLEAKLADLDDRYTRDYLELQPSLKALPERIGELRTEIEIGRRLGNQRALEEAMQEQAAAGKAVDNIRLQLDQHKKQAKVFTTIFAEHRSRVSDLENLEELKRTTQSRLAQIEAKQMQNYPQVTVITRATVSDTPIGPDYTRNTLFTLAAALGISVFAVWLLGFLNPALAPNRVIPVATVHIHANDKGEALPHPRQKDTRIEDKTQLGLGLQEPDDEDHPPKNDTYS